MSTHQYSCINLAGCAAFDSELNESVTLLKPLESELEKLSTANIGIDSVPNWYARLSQRETSVQKAIIEYTV